MYPFLEQTEAEFRICNSKPTKSTIRKDPEKFWDQKLGLNYVSPWNKFGPMKHYAMSESPLLLIPWTTQTISCGQKMAMYINTVQTNCTEDSRKRNNYEEGLTNYAPFMHACQTQRFCQKWES